jgi:2-methylcitrate dehydratase PrpD
MTTPMRTTSTETISQQLADYVVGLRFEDLPDEVVGKAKELLAYHVGLAFLGRGLKRGQQVVSLAFELSGTDGRCSIVGERRRADPLEAVFANSGLMICVGLHDFVGGVNPGLAVHPSALAVSEMMGRSGRELLTAVAAGYDVMAKLQEGGPLSTWDIDVPRPLKFVLAPFGAAATATRLLGLSRNEIVDAFGHAGQSGMGIYEGAEHLWVMHPLAARNGVMAAMLAKAGISAAPTILEGRHGVYRSLFLNGPSHSLEDSLATLGKEFAISHVGTNRYWASALNANPIERAQQLVAEHALTPDDLTTIDLVLPEEREAREAAYDHYANRGPRFLVAIVLSDGRLEPARFEDPPGADLLAVVEKVRLRFERGRPLYYARIEVTTTNGERYVAERDSPTEPPPLDYDAWIAKCGQAIVSEAQLTRLIELLRNLEDVPDIAEVTACVAAP